jgi:hypothetical protein
MNESGRGGNGRLSVESSAEKPTSAPIPPVRANSAIADIVTMFMAMSPSGRTEAFNVLDSIQGSKTENDEKHDGETRPRRSEERQELIRQLKTVSKDGKQTGCLKGEKAGAIQRSLAGPPLKGSRKTMKRRLQSLKNQRRKTQDKDEQEAIDRKIERTHSRLKRLDETGKPGGFVNVITDVDKARGPGKGTSKRDVPSRPQSSEKTKGITSGGSTQKKE